MADVPGAKGVAERILCLAETTGEPTEAGQLSVGDGDRSGVQAEPSDVWLAADHR